MMPTYSATSTPIPILYTLYTLYLLNDTLLEILGEVGADLFAGALDSHLGHVGVDHKVDELLKRGLF